MKDITTEKHKLVKVTRANFEEFLKQENELWDVDNEDLEDIIGHCPVTVDELIDGIQMSGGGSD